MQPTLFFSHTFWFQSTENFVIRAYDSCMNNSDLMWQLLQGYMCQAVQKEHTSSWQEYKTIKLCPLWFIIVIFLFVLKQC